MFKTSCMKDVGQIEIPLVNHPVSVDSEILHRVRTTSRSVIVAGHYSLADHMRELSSEGDAEQQSFKVGVDLVKEAVAHGNDSHLVLWINDIGISPAERNDIRNRKSVAKNYQRIMRDAKFDQDQLVVMFESSMRNKASTLLRRMYKNEPDLFEKVNANSSGLVRCVGSAACNMIKQNATVAYVVEGPDGCSYSMMYAFSSLPQIG